MIFRVFFIIFLWLSSIASAQAVHIRNGDFAEGGKYWGTNSDGIGASNDIVFHNAAILSIDYYATKGDVGSRAISSASFGNTLTQRISVSGPATQQLSLSFDWLLEGESIGNEAQDYFIVGLIDGLGRYYNENMEQGLLIAPTSSYGSGHYSVMLDEKFNSSPSDWILDFSLLTGFEGKTWRSDGYGSKLTIDNIALSVIKVPEPLFINLWFFGLLGLISIRLRK